MGLLAKNVKSMYLEISLWGRGDGWGRSFLIQRGGSGEVDECFQQVYTLVQSWRPPVSVYPVQRRSRKTELGFWVLSSLDSSLVKCLLHPTWIWSLFLACFLLKPPSFLLLLSYLYIFQKATWMLWLFIWSCTPKTCLFPSWHPLHHPPLTPPHSCGLQLFTLNPAMSIPWNLAIKPRICLPSLLPASKRDLKALVLDCR